MTKWIYLNGFYICPVQWHYNYMPKTVRFALVANDS